MTTPYRERKADEATPSCSFCTKSAAEVNKLVAGPPNVAICDECVGLCNDILGEDSTKAAPEEPPKGPPDRAEIAKTLDASAVGCADAKRVLSAALIQQALQASPCRARRILLVG